jgi:integrase
LEYSSAVSYKIFMGNSDRYFLFRGSPLDCSKVRRAHEAGLKAAGLRHIRVHDLRGTYASLGDISGSTCLPCLKVSRAFRNLYDRKALCEPRPRRGA